MSKRKMIKKRPRGGASHPCPRCENSTHVIITRRFQDYVRRHRQCLTCGHDYWTKEVKHNAA